MMRKLMLCVAATGLLALTPAIASADYTVWTNYGGKWWSSATTPNYSTAQYYQRLFQQYGYQTTITTGAYPGQTATPTKTAYYYARVYYGTTPYYMGAYLSSSAAYNAGLAYARAYPGRAHFYGEVFTVTR
jgi:hypothetical protein